ncbi:MAG TPA: AAA family ATPase [Bacteroidia bacterium]|jgi:SpoVK/Ycf46/Vps4 family AAA+-type ATPase|nr:AAA family ATPase [Bacteroidia bacterium]
MEKRFKFKTLSVYSSDEWMANSTKRYRTVFDKAETTYIRCELALYNKLFDEEDWQTKVTIRCEKVIPGNNEKICELEVELKVNKDENIAYVRDGWGNATPGIFWKKGTYKWMALIEGVVVGESQFHIEDVGLVTSSSNPYFSIEHVKLYPGDVDGWQQRQRKYLKTFNKTTTQYVWAEIKIKVLTNVDFNYELFLNYIDDAGQPKAHQNKTGYTDVNKKDYTYTFDLGWGHNTPGSWKDDQYTLEVVFMDVLIGGVTFQCKEIEEEGTLELITSIQQTISSASNNAAANTSTAAPEKTLEELLDEVKVLIGLENVKKSINENITYLKFNQLRKEKGFDDTNKISLHSVFTGNPGTGKTTIVKMLGKIYNKMGLLSKGHVFEVDRSVLVGEYIGQTAPKVKKAIEDARGGILFIDEAYSLSRSGEDSKDFGKEVIEILLKEMSDGPGDIAIIVAGYPKEMDTFIESNPGLKSRFTEYFHFEDYLPEELHQIAVYTAGNKQVTIAPEADSYLKEQLTDAYRKRDKSFGNARFVNGLIEEAKQNMGIRIMKGGNLESITKEDLSVITFADLKQVFSSGEKKKLNLNVNEKDLQLALAELNELTGMDNIKNDLNELVKLIKFYNEIGKDVINKFSLHSVFTGNPGTGKTTLARTIAKVYKALGLLERGHIVEVDREGLIAGYVGQTAIKTQEKIDAAMGGILFIDEAYALAEGGGQNDFGKEAIEVILKRMEDQRGKFGVIVAGYPDNMFKFIEMNPGLKSRFDKTFNFYDYTAEQLLQIADVLVKKEGLTISPDAKEHLNKYFNAIYEKRDKFFGNARTVRQAIGEVVMKQNLRMASVPAAQRTPEALSSLIFDDVKHLAVESGKSSSSLGFRFGATG